MLKLPIKKSGIHLSLKLKRQTHPWDMIEELAKTKHLKQPAETHAVSRKQFNKHQLSFNEEPSDQGTEILMIPQTASPELNMKDNLQLFEEQEEPNEGFFLCPSCTCWFTNKKDLDFHIKRWCDR